jgi:FlaA1/EpsC-like NDP-sugar epimerase
MTKSPYLHTFKAAVVSLPQGFKLLTLTIGDFIAFLVAIYTAIGFRFGFSSPIAVMQTYGLAITLIVSAKLLIFWLTGVYKPVLRYIGAEFAPIILRAVAIGFVVSIGLNFILPWTDLPISVLVNDVVLTMLSVIYLRLSFRSVLTKILYSDAPAPNTARAAIYGAGSAGNLLYDNLVRESGYQPVCFIDDCPDLYNRVLNGLKVYAPTELQRLKSEGQINVVLLAMPTVSANRRKEIIKSLQSLAISIKTVPSISEILTEGGSANQIRDIDIEDLLGREQIAPLPELMQADITGKVVLVTGAGGSIGSELCRQIARLQPQELVLYDLSEFALYQIDLELGESHPSLTKSAYLGSVADRQRLGWVMRDRAIQTVYHAAAYKHVPLVEANVVAGVRNNIIGTWTAAAESIAAGVEKFVLISTDKAVRPTNVMGATKRVTELILQALAEKGTDTCLTMVRFGNVLGSSGSVIPRFQQQLVKGQPLTVTHQDINRYFMSIPEAATLVIQAGAMAKGGEVFLLDMGEPVRIYDLAAQMIRINGLEPDVDVPIEITGLRPGEKIYEELLLDMDLALPTQHPKIFCAREDRLDWDVLNIHLARLETEIANNHAEGCLALLHTLVPEYQPSQLSSPFGGVSGCNNRPTTFITPVLH